MVKIDNIAKQNAEQWLSSKTIDQATKDSINDMMKNNIGEFNESFYRHLAFGTGGLRGIMGIGTDRKSVV